MPADEQLVKLVVTLTTGEDNPDKATVAFVVANAGVASGVGTLVFLSNEAAWLTQQGFADAIHEEGFKPLRELIETFTANGGTIWVCGSCFRKRQLSQDRLIAGTTVVGGASLVEVLSQGAAVISY
jgi:predicted peroxiredoxin